MAAVRVEAAAPGARCRRSAPPKLRTSRCGARTITNHAASRERRCPEPPRVDEAAADQYAAVSARRRELLRTQQLLEEMAPFAAGPLGPFEPYGEGAAEETMDERAQRWRRGARRRHLRRADAAQAQFTRARTRARSLAMETRPRADAPPATPSVASTSRASSPPPIPVVPTASAAVVPKLARIDRARRRRRGGRRAHRPDGRAWQPSSRARRRGGCARSARATPAASTAARFGRRSPRSNRQRRGGGGAAATTGSISERCDAWHERREEAARKADVDASHHTTALARELEPSARSRPAVAADDAGAAAAEAVAARDERRRWRPGADEPLRAAGAARALAGISARGAGAAPTVALRGNARDADGFPIGRAAPIIRAPRNARSGARRAVAARPPTAALAAARASTARALPPGDYFGRGSSC